jgi:hypothetical protein
LPTRRAPLLHEVGQGAALVVFLGDLPSEDLTVDVRGDGGEDQPLHLGRFEGFDLPLHRVFDVEAVATGEGLPPGIAALALGRRQPVVADLVVGEQYW